MPEELDHDRRPAPCPAQEALAFDIGFALPRVPVRGLRRAFTEDERRRIATAIVEHLKLCRGSLKLCR
jgi:hypothetical protein